MPLATLEGTLVASASRGAKLLQEAGGVRAWTGLARCIRTPVFVMESPDQAVVFGEWAIRKTQKLKEIAAQHTNMAVCVT